MKSRYYFLPLLSGILLILCWPPLPFTPLVFCAFVPLLILAEKLPFNKQGYRAYFLYVYLAMFIWNVGTTYWLYNAVIAGPIAIHLINPLILTIPFYVYRISSRLLKRQLSFIVLVSSWITMELIHHEWELAYPFLTLGNSLSKFPQIIQFYEYTGVWGGSLWIWLVNIALYNTWKAYRTKSVNIKWKWALNPLLFLLVPFILSVYMFYSYRESGNTIRVAAVHSNIDVRSEKYSRKVNDLIIEYIDLCQDKVDQTTDYILWPESAITDAGWVSLLNGNDGISTIRDYLNKHPKSNLVSGAIIYEASVDKNSDELDRRYQKYSERSGVWYYTYSAALHLNGSNQQVYLRTKKKLVPVEERIPFSDVMIVVRKIFPSLGGFTLSSRKIDNDIFVSNSGVKSVTLICYETLFGSLTSQYVRDGAQVIFTILNEGWYKHMTGSRQFMYYASIRAIESRRSIARASNEGISGFIDQRGIILNSTDKFEPAVITEEIHLNKKHTIYTLFGDYLAIISTVVFSGLCLLILYQKFSK